MAKVTLNHLFETASGKLCKKSGTYVALNKRTGKMYTAEYHDRAASDTEAQQEIRTAFKQKSKLAAAWWKANKPSTANAAGTANYQLVMKAYKSQTKIGNPYSYLRTLVTPEMKVKLGDLDITDGASSSVSTTTGGGSSTGGGVEA